MDERSYLHDGERLLLSMGSSSAVFVRHCFRAVIEAIIAGALIGTAAEIGWWFAFAGFFHWSAILILIVLILVALCIRRWSLWKKGRLRVTTDRILLQPAGLFSMQSLKTIKWNQYQESATSKGGILDMLLGGRHMTIRYGTADAQRQTTFPSLKFGNDIKHYMDKVDSAVRAGKIAEVREFVPRPKGKRD